MAVETTTATHTIVHYEIMAKDSKALTRFYSSVFGWQFGGAPGMDDDYMTMTGGDNDAAVAIYQPEGERRPPTNYVGVENVKTYSDKITAAGGKIVHTFTVPHMGRGAIGQDPEGNMIGIWQEDRSAQPE
jgi:predicted enzyme related to lactoylglutathione lyase